MRLRVSRKTLARECDPSGPTRQAAATEGLRNPDFTPGVARRATRVRNRSHLPVTQRALQLDGPWNVANSCK
ncbi:hypothetical protein HZ326_7437 [Fusarium oxysporum f. sp. albedinis]|nr:hypothetical protein HZ326_7437 [Fusarium oxysporum f. sp. albedinis]